MNKRLTQLKELSPDEWQVLIISLMLLPSIALALHTRGYKWTLAFLQKRIPPDGHTPIKAQNSLEVAQSIARIVTIAANHGPYRANCLKRSMATWWLLQRRGIAAELIFGVNKNVENLNAHAWVEYMGHCLLEDNNVEQRYSALK